MPQLQADGQELIYQQDGDPPRFHHNIREYNNSIIPRRWIELASRDDSPHLPWPPRSHDLTPYDFFLLGDIKDHVFVPLCHMI